MNIVERVTVLRTVELFAGTPGRVLAALAEIAGEVEVSPGEIVLREGDFGQTLFVVMAGELVAERQGRHLATLGPGSVVGEFAVFVPEPRSATVRALTSSRLMSIGKEAVDELLLDYPEVAFSIIAALVRRFQERNRLLGEAVG